MFSVLLFEIDILPRLKAGDSYCGWRCSANPLRRVRAADNLTALFTSHALRTCPALIWLLIAPPRFPDRASIHWLPQPHPHFPYSRILRIQIRPAFGGFPLRYNRSKGRFGLYFAEVRQSDTRHSKPIYTPTAVWIPSKTGLISPGSNLISVSRFCRVLPLTVTFLISPTTLRLLR